MFADFLLFSLCDQVYMCLCVYLYGPAPGFDVLLSRLDAKLHVADVRAELPGLVAVKCSVLKCLLRFQCVCIYVSQKKKDEKDFLLNSEAYKTKCTHFVNFNEERVELRGKTMCETNETKFQ